MSAFEAELRELATKHSTLDRSEMVEALDLLSRELVNTADDMCPYPVLYGRGDCCGVFPCKLRADSRARERRPQ